MEVPDDGPVGDSVLRMIASTNPLRDGGEELGDEIEFDHMSFTFKRF